MAYRVVIRGGGVNVTGTGNAYGITAYDEITITCGRVTATGNTNGICAGDNGNITLGLRNDTDYITASSYSAGGSVTIADGQSVYNGNEVLTGTLTDMSKLNGKMLVPYIESTFAADGTAILYDNDAGMPDGHKNADRLTDLDDNQPHNVRLSGRTLYKDGGWNTLCLPFDVTLADSPLTGAEARTLNSASIEDSELTLNFSDPVATIAAGTPFIIKWASSENIVSPEFSNVTISNTTNDKVCTISDEVSISFVGTYKKLDFDADDPSILLVGDENSLYYPQAGAFLGAQRAYFILDGITAGTPASSIKSMVLNFEDEEAMGIEELKDGKVEKLKLDDVWYTLQGVQLDGKPTQKGVYIHNGKKIMIK
jgi:hypothetical protein